MLVKGANCTFWVMGLNFDAGEHKVTLLCPAEIYTIMGKYFQANAAIMFPHLRQEHVTPTDFPSPRDNWGAPSQQKAKKHDSPRERAAPRQGELGPPDVPRGPPGAWSPGWAPQLEATLAFPPFWGSWQKKARPRKGEGVAGPWDSGQD